MREYDPLADLYDLEYDHNYDLPFWLALAERESGPVVEWGAGTGRLAAPLACAGLDVTAVEVSDNMVEKGREKGDAVEWVRGDMRHVKLGGRYGLAVCAFNSFLCLLSLVDALAFLRNAWEHLKPNGLLGIEVSAFAPEELCEGAEGPALRHDFTREWGQVTPERTLERFSVSRYDAASQLLRMRLFYELYGRGGELENKRAHDLTIRIVGRGELELMLRLAGFEVEAVYGGFEAEPFTAGSDHLIVLARQSQVGFGARWLATVPAPERAFFAARGETEPHGNPSLLGLFAELRTGGILERILGAMEQRRIGIEQEFFLVDREGTPSDRADECLARCREAAGEDLISECFVVEVSKSMVEILR